MSGFKYKKERCKHKTYRKKTTIINLEKSLRVFELPIFLFRENYGKETERSVN